MKFKSLEDFLARWYNDKDTIREVYDRKTYEENMRILLRPVDRDILRYYRRHLESVFKAVDVDMTLFKDSKRNQYRVDEKAVADLFEYALYIVERNEFSYISKQKFEEVSDETLWRLCLYLYGALSAIGYSRERQDDIMERYKIRTGSYLRKRPYELPVPKRPELVLKLEEVALRYLRYSNELSTPPSERKTEHYPFSDAEWTDILNDLEKGHIEIWQTFRKHWLAEILRRAREKEESGTL